MSTPPFYIQNLDGLLSTSWTDILPPYNYHNVCIYAGSSPLFLTTAGSGQLIIPAGGSQMIAAPPLPGGRVRFIAGQNAFQLRTQSGDGTGVYLLWA